MKPQKIETLGNKWLCPECGTRFRKQKQCQTHIINYHKKKGVLGSLMSWLKRKDQYEVLTNIRQSKEAERRYGNEQE